MARGSITLVFGNLLWFCLTWILILDRVNTNNFNAAKNIRSQVVDCPYSHYPLLSFLDVRTWSDYEEFVEKCFVPFFFVWADFLNKDEIYTKTPWGWPATKLQDPTVMRTGYIQLWSTRTGQDAQSEAAPLKILGLTSNRTEGGGWVQGGATMIRRESRRGTFTGIDRSYDLEVALTATPSTERCSPLTPQPQPHLHRALHTRGKQP